LHQPLLDACYEFIEVGPLLAKASTRPSQIAFPRRDGVDKAWAV
jgi:hypothetical protein